MVCSGGAGGISEKREKVCLFGKVGRLSFCTSFLLAKRLFGCYTIHFLILAKGD